ncbi:hypothetical protein I7I48_11798 [Histoplasma ohiense]|nr:hypothetical protein I7I48_11798 [Histoplasma ohiense (nom. inval.)]
MHPNFNKRKHGFSASAHITRIPSHVGDCSCLAGLAGRRPFEKPCLHLLCVISCHDPASSRGSNNCVI